ncbi:MAG: AmmeMemoRadiSam system protein B, partial [Planctomycetes bacterium]|nr:AmmeMemoRadiSam system protein B [Planctomycetota bacterium]
QGRLRGCCGVMGSPIRLDEALARSARRTAVEDHRLPPISPSELPFLDLEVWLLYHPQLIEEQGEDRVQAVEIGKHGLQIALGDRRGLLLPGVAVENKLDAEGFLRQVCLKAGLRPDAWMDDAAQVQRFEGVSIPGPMEVEKEATKSDRLELTHHELEMLADFCRQNTALLLRGASPTYYLPGGPEGSINGAALSISFNGGPAVSHVSRLSFRPEIPLQSTLFSLAEGAAQALRNSRAVAPQKATVDIELTLLTDPAMHGTAESPDLRGFDPETRALAVIERRKSAWVFDPSKAPEAILKQAADEAQVLTPQDAGVYSFRVKATKSPAMVTTTPRGGAGADVRPPGVAGTFYPADADELNALVEEMLEGEREPAVTCHAVMVPHAGLRYSGRIAAQTLKRTEIPDAVIVIGPKHTPWGVEWAVAPHRRWQLPGGTVESDPELAQELVDAIPGLQLDSAAHQREHAVEVELPFIAKLAPSARVVGVALGAGDLARCRQFSEGLANVIRAREERGEKVLLVISSDLNHFATDEENRRLDEMVLSAMESLDPETLYNTVRDHQISMCGVLPAVIAMDTLRRLGRLERCQRVGYATSADVSGDKSRVVGYAGMLLR